MAARITLGDITVAVTRKDIKNLHLNVHPPDGRVTIAAPRHLSLKAVRAFAIDKLRWIRQQQRKLAAQVRETPREYLNRETHYVWGQRCLLQLIETDARPRVEWRGRRLTLFVRPSADCARRAAVIAAWYREQLRLAVEPLMSHWEQQLGVRAGHLFVQRMRTRWGSCNPRSGGIRLNTELATKPRECLEYILVHELLHLRVPKHDAAFVGLLDCHLPDWLNRRELLNRLPVRHEDWA